VYKRIRQADVSPELQEKQSKDTAAAYFGTIEGNFVRLLLNNPDRIKEARHFILPETFSDQFSGKLYSMLLTSYDEDARLTTLLGSIPDEETKRIISYAYALEAPGEDAREEVIHTIGRLQSKYLQKQIRDISDRMRKEPRNRTELLERLKEYSTQLKALSDT
jgi:hypothetical protein